MKNPTTKRFVGFSLYLTKYKIGLLTTILTTTGVNIELYLQIQVLGDLSIASVDRYYFKSDYTWVSFLTAPDDKLPDFKNTRSVNWSGYFMRIDN